MNAKIDSDHTKLIFDYMRIDGKVETLLEFLLRRFRYLDGNEWKKNIEKERLWVDDKLGYANLKLNNKQKIIYLVARFSILFCFGEKRSAPQMKF